jgi:hypothetical protein
MAAVLRRFGGDLRSLAHPGMFTEMGEWGFQNLVEAFNDAGESQWEMLRGLDLSNQPYNFSYARFSELNPPAADTDESGREAFHAGFSKAGDPAERDVQEIGAVPQPA